MKMKLFLSLTTHLFLALNEIHDLKQLVETQDSAIEELKSQLNILAKK